MAKVIYTAEATVTGGRAEGHGVTSDGALDVQLRMPPEMGGEGGGHEPRAAVRGRLRRLLRERARRDRAARARGGRRRVDRQQGRRWSRPRSAASRSGSSCTSACPRSTTPSWRRGSSRGAHAVCPYSNATRGNIDVTLTANGRDVLMRILLLCALILGVLAGEAPGGDRLPVAVRQHRLLHRQGRRALRHPRPRLLAAAQARVVRARLGERRRGRQARPQGILGLRRRHGARRRAHARLRRQHPARRHALPQPAVGHALPEPAPPTTASRSRATAHGCSSRCGPVQQLAVEPPGQRAEAHSSRS